MLSSQLHRSAWHHQAIADVFKNLEANEHGLSEAEAQRRLSQIGPNNLPQKPPAPLWLIILRQFRSQLIYILALAAVVSVALDHAV